MPTDEIPPPAPEFEPQESPTRVTCLACGGTSRVGGGVVGCRWCSSGTMTTDQIRAWKGRKP